MESESLCHLGAAAARQCDDLNHPTQERLRYLQRGWQVQCHRAPPCSRSSAAPSVLGLVFLALLSVLRLWSSEKVNANAQRKIHGHTWHHLCLQCYTKTPANISSLWAPFFPHIVLQILSCGKTGFENRKQNKQSKINKNYRWTYTIGHRTEAKELLSFILFQKPNYENLFQWICYQKYFNVFYGLKSL